MMKIKIDLIWRRSVYYVKRALQWVMIDHGHLLNVLAIIVVLLVAAYMLVTLLWLEPPNLDKVGKTSPNLSVDRIERLGQWIDDRQEERGRVLEVPEGVFP